MSDLGDSFREWRESKRKAKASWVTCWRCGTKNDPRDECRTCGLKPASAHRDVKGEGA